MPMSFLLPMGSDEPRNPGRSAREPCGADGLCSRNRARLERASVSNGETRALRGPFRAHASPFDTPAPADWWGSLDSVRPHKALINLQFFHFK